MNNSDSLSKIPVIVEQLAKSEKQLHWKRKFSQISFIIIFLLIPISGLFRIDIAAGGFVVLDYQIRFSEFFIVFGFWLAIASGLVLTYSAFGTVFCGWICPQNTLSEWGNRQMQKWLGRHAKTELGGHAMHVSSGKKKLSNWVILISMFVAMSMLTALIPMFYFFPPTAMWSFITFHDDARLVGSLYWIYFVFVSMVFVDITFIRHFLCRFMCVYRIWQHSFKTRETLRIQHDKSQSEECEKCKFCESVCIVKIDPKNTDTYDACINCGECIAACAGIRLKRSGESSLLRFKIGSTFQERSDKLSSLGLLFKRVKVAVPVTILSSLMFVWGVVNYEPFRFAVYQNDQIHGKQISDYRTSVMHKRYRPSQVSFRLEGLPEGSYRWSNNNVSFETAGRKNVLIHVNDSLAPGIYRFTVFAKSIDGWEDSFKVHHVEVKNDV